MFQSVIRCRCLSTFTEWKRRRCTVSTFSTELRHNTKPKWFLRFAVYFGDSFASCVLFDFCIASLLWGRRNHEGDMSLVMMELFLPVSPASTWRRAEVLTSTEQTSSSRILSLSIGSRRLSHPSQLRRWLVELLKRKGNKCSASEELRARRPCIFNLTAMLHYVKCQNFLISNLYLSPVSHNTLAPQTDG